jgi:hypothetical protein
MMKGHGWTIMLLESSLSSLTSFSDLYRSVTDDLLDLFAHCFDQA